MPVYIQLDSLKQRRDVQNPIATTLDNFELVLEAFHKPTCVPVNKVRRDVVEPVLSRGHKAIEASSFTRAYLLHPLPNLALPLSFAPLRVQYRCEFMTELRRHFQANALRAD